MPHPKNQRPIQFSFPTGPVACAHFQNGALPTFQAWCCALTVLNPRGECRVADKLIAQVEAFVRERGGTHVVLSTLVEMKAACKLYGRNGYTPDHTTPFVMSPSTSSNLLHQPCAPSLAIPTHTSSSHCMPEPRVKPISPCSGLFHTLTNNCVCPTPFPMHCSVPRSAGLRACLQS